MAINSEDKTIALELAYEGKTIVSIARSLKMTRQRLVFELKYDPEFKRQFDEAMTSGDEVMADKLQDALEHYPDVTDARLMSDNYKFLLSRRLNTLYGNKMDMTVNKTIDVSGILERAAARVNPHNATRLELNQPSEIVIENDASHPESDSDDITIDDLF